MVIDWLEKNGLSYVKPGGGLYIYVNFSKVSNHVLVSLEVVLSIYIHCCSLKFLTDITPEAEVALWNKFFDAGVYITPSKAFNGAEPGWFRIVFAEEPSLLKLGRLSRVYTMAT